jgi:hypothetical protein
MSKPPTLIGPDPVRSNHAAAPSGQDQGPRLGPVQDPEGTLAQTGLPPIPNPQLPSPALPSPALPGVPPQPSFPVQPVAAEKVGEKKEPLVEALRCVLANHHDQALEALRGYDAKTQEVFLQMLPALALLAQKKVDELSAAEAAALNGQLQNLLAALRPRTELVVGRMCFCEWVKSYGVYKPLPDAHVFQAGTAHHPGEQARLYVELGNICSERRDGYHETRLNSSVEITDARGTRVWYYRFDDRNQPLRSWTRVNDYYNNYTFHVPHIAPGVYTLTIQVTDETLPDQKRSAKKSVPFQVRTP